MNYYDPCMQVHIAYDMLSVAAQAAPPAVGGYVYLIFKYVLVAASLIGVIKCLWIVRREETHTIGVASLALALSGLASSVVLDDLVRTGWIQGMNVGLNTFAVFIVFSISFVLGIFALMDMHSQRGRYTQGSSQAWGGITLSILFFAVGSMILATKISQSVAGLSRQQSPTRVTVTTDVSGTWLNYEDLNFRFRKPGIGWTRLNRGEDQSDAILFYMDQHQETYFEVLAEKIGVGQGLTLEGMVKIVRSNLDESSSQVKVLSQLKKTVGGVAATDLRADARVEGQWYSYKIRVIECNGYVYQLHCWTTQAGRSEIDRRAGEVFDRFVIIDPERIAYAEGQIPTGNDRHTGWGYRVDAQDSGWVYWDNLEADAAEATYGALYGDELGMVIIPVQLVGPEPKRAEIVGAMLEYFGVAYPSDAVTDVQVITRANAKGYRVTMHRFNDGTPMRYRIDMLYNGRATYMVAGWTIGDRDASLEAVDDMLERVAILPPEVSEFDGIELTDAQRRYSKALHHRFALEAYNTRRLDDALVYLKHSYLLVPEDEQELINIVNVMIELRRHDGALVYLREHIGAHEDNQEVRANLAWLLHANEEYESALEGYSSLFDDGFEDGDYFGDYVSLLQKLGRRKDAAAQLDEYLERKPTASLGRMRAQIYKEQKQFNEGIELLNEYIDRGPFDAQTAYDLAVLYYMSDRAEQSIVMCERLLEEGYKTWENYYVKGLSEIELESYRAAKASFKRAADLNPSNEEIAQYVNFLTSMVEQGGGQVGVGAEVEKDKSETPRVGPPRAPR